MVMNTSLESRIGGGCSHDTHVSYFGYYFDPSFFFSIEFWKPSFCCYASQSVDVQYKSTCIFQQQAVSPLESRIRSLDWSTRFASWPFVVYHHKRFDCYLFAGINSKSISRVRMETIPFVVEFESQGIQSILPLESEISSPYSSRRDMRHDKRISSFLHPNSHEWDSRANALFRSCVNQNMILQPCLSVERFTVYLLNWSNMFAFTHWLLNVIRTESLYLLLIRPPELLFQKSCHGHGSSYSSSSWWSCTRASCDEGNDEYLSLDVLDDDTLSRF